jgi:hypothetical protein
MRKLLVPFLVAGCGSPVGAPVADGGVSADLATVAAPDLAVAAPPGKSYSLAPFTLAPGDEKINCYYVPPDGVERYVSRIVVDMKPGSHHLVVFRIKDAVGMPTSGPTPCSQLDIPQGFDGLFPGSQQQHTEYTFPDGVAVKLEKDHGLLFQSHYINASAKEIVTGVDYRLTVAPREQVKQVAGMIFYSNFGLMVPPGKSTQSRTCRSPFDLRLLSVTGHMHKRGLTFDASIDGKNVYHTDRWDEPAFAAFPLPGYEVKKDSPITYECTYDNETGKTIRFGNSAATDEMCILAGLYYPSQNGETLFQCR